MRIRFSQTGVVLLLFVIPQMAMAGTYQWVDSVGVTHFSSNPEDIPASYRKQIRELPPAAPGQKEAAPLAAAALKQEQTRKRAELKKLLDELPRKKKELYQLRRKWLTMKGRTPTPEELAEFEKKRAQGQVKAGDNPFVNKNPLSTPGPGREAYFKKLDEVSNDEATIARLQKELEPGGREERKVEEPVGQYR